MSTIAVYLIILQFFSLFLSPLFTERQHYYSLSSHNLLPQSLHGWTKLNHNCTHTTELNHSWTHATINTSILRQLHHQTIEPTQPQPPVIYGGTIDVNVIIFFLKIYSIFSLFVLWFWGYWFDLVVKLYFIFVWSLGLGILI